LRYGAASSYTSKPNISHANTRYGLYKQPSETCGITGCKPISLCDIGSSHGGNDKQYCLLGCDDVYIGKKGSNVSVEPASSNFSVLREAGVEENSVRI
jgi:hypothetical protein